RENFEITEGMKIAQMVIKPTYEVNITEVNNLSDTSRGEGGFGSTGI
ncbi:MAG: dUTP diphosphatase, partial [Candidatus Delongbacteria bacterium]|nr:dUTP diphosphatase [Candidatus Delongbacteria bacterium]